MVLFLKIKFYQDFSKQNKMMDPDMQRICLSGECHRELLVDYFVGNIGDTLEPRGVPRINCCHNCDLKLVV